MENLEVTKNQLEAAVIRRAWESEEFKNKLFTNPKEALNELGYSVAHNVEICVHQEHKNKMVLVLPENPLGVMHDIFNVNPTGPNIPHITHVGPACGAEPGKPKGPEPQKPPDTLPKTCRMSEPGTKPKQSPDVPNATFKGGSCNTAVHCVNKPNTPPPTPGPAGPSRKM